MSPHTGYIAHVDTEAYGLASLALGAGRNTAEDAIDYSAGIMLGKKTGDFVQQGEKIATMYADSPDLFAAAEARFLGATQFSEEKPEAEPLVYDIIE